MTNLSQGNNICTPLQHYTFCNSWTTKTKSFSMICICQFCGHSDLTFVSRCCQQPDKLRAQNEITVTKINKYVWKRENAHVVILK